MGTLRSARGLTLVEMLVVVAIILILAAILFAVLIPVKSAAKQVSSLSNLKQIGVGMQLYLADSNDVYPRQDDCMAPARVPWNSAAVGCGGSPGFGQRINHFKWPWWIYPYTRNGDVYRSPGREIDPVAFRKDGEFRNAYALNTAITGMTNTWPVPDNVGAWRASFIGGMSSSIPEPGQTMLFIEFFQKVTWTYLTPFASQYQTAWPLATREVWDRYLRPNGKIEPTRAPRGGGFLLATTDTSARYYTVGGFLSRCPEQADYTVSTPPATFPVGTTWTITSDPDVTGSWPLWGLEG